eukprot:CAMPEP_0194047910 /NCGR_PEP_ID=MMETSP0009_2-20130614/26139_1 /TAXON_ID=210454 /ORGANISM="Grammatophora oceanica, Strain CCMP 410" /LENGTH=223 /DNA_ID=CAMNT_0038693667 /DNA_START=125 /DNA_END=796 /DNA_ORIENTATION=+
MYNKAISLNNKGVSQIEKGTFDDARKSFRSALDAMRSAVIQSQEEIKDKTDNTSAGDAAVVFQWSSNAPLSDGSTSPIGSSFVYRRALHIIQAQVGDRATGFPEESAAIVFNLALSSHLIGLQTNNSSMLEKALQFYEIANNIRQRKNEEHKLLGEQLLDAAILNNQGQIYHEFIEYGSAQRCFDQLSSRLVTLSRGGFLEQKDSEGFILNLMIQAPSLAAAA